MVRETLSVKLRQPNRLILFHNPATLQNLSAIATAVRLWRDELLKHDVHARPLKASLPLAKSIPQISKQLEKLIDKYVEPVRISLILWLKSQFLAIFLPYEKEYDVLRTYFDCITWHPDCTVDYETTAMKLIACAEVSAVCKYKIACTYCLEDDIRRLWNDLPQDYHKLSDIMYSVNFLARYWDCRMKVDPSLSAGGSINGQLFDKLEPENWLAWNYCWSRLPPDQRIDKAVDMIESKKGMKNYVKKLLPLLTKLEIVKILPRCSKNIVTVLASSPENVTYALQTWEFVKNFTTRDSFVKMFEDVLSSDLDVNTIQFASVVQNYDHPNSLKFFDIAHMMNVNVSSLLYEIWRNSPDHLKSHLIDNHAAQILEKLSKMDNLFTMNGLCRDVRLMLELLSRRDTLVNNTFWRKRWTELVKGVKSIHLEEIMKLCFRHEKEITKFKKSHMTVYSKIENYCNELICEGNFDELNDFLYFCTSDQNVVIGWKRAMLTNPVHKFRFCVFYADDAAKMKAFDEFISQIYPEPDRVKSFKNHMITSPTNFEFLQNCVTKGFLIPIKTFVNLFLADAAELKSVKKELLQKCRCILTKGEFGSFCVDSWNEFLLWCLDEDPQKLDQFKKSLSVNDIYQIVFPKCVQDVASRLTKIKTLTDEYTKENQNYGKKNQPELKVSKGKKKRDSSPGVNEALDNLAWDKNDFVDDYIDGFENFDNFLLWYFASKDKVTEFKLAKIKKRSVLRKVSDIKNERLFKIVLYWCFDRDVETMKTFAQFANE